MKKAVDLLEDISRLMKLKGENPFKVRAYERAIQSISGREDLDERARAGTLTQIEGIGKGIEQVLTEFLLEGGSSAREALIREFPEGFLELSQIPGLGPKKTLLLIQELGIQSVAELEYACRENRLLNLKGFGEKTQKKILEGIEFYQAHQGQRRLPDAEADASVLLEAFHQAFPETQIEATGALRRRSEILGELEFLVEADSDPVVSRLEAWRVEFLAELPSFLPTQFYYTVKRKWGYEQARRTGTPAHWQALGSPAEVSVETETEFFKLQGLPVIPVEARETGEEVQWARMGGLAQLLPLKGIRGIFHNHTTRSDGSATLEAMVQACHGLGFEYIGISDHSRSAFYAQGLHLDALGEQEAEVRELQKKYPDVRIFWGIESDILADGSLDYDEEVLRRFDFVIASVHSRFGMDQAAMTERILKAIRNPFTRFLGHPTGRLLLGRKGYALDMEKIIQEAAKHQVAVELNAHPSRLDLDWRWGPQMRRYGTMTSINPDAHEIAGLDDVEYGIAMARKALLPVHQVLNSRSAVEVERWLRRQ